MKVYRSRKSGLAIRESYDRLLAFWSCETKERDVATAYGTTHVIECGKWNPCRLSSFMAWAMILR